LTNARPLSLAIAAASVVVLTACGGSSSAPAKATSSSPPASTSAAPTSEASGATGPATINLVPTTNGKILTDSGGQSLYLFTVDKDASSSCYDQCATNWPPVLTTGAPKAGTGVDDGLLGTTKRSDGTVQVTYNKSPLYRFAKDTHPGWVKGQGVKNTWWLVSADGAAVKTKS
jgi:predicted lipoprotein with Yx(FWY)xxD motif